MQNNITNSTAHILNVSPLVGLHEGCEDQHIQGADQTKDRSLVDWTNSSAGRSCSLRQRKSQRRHHIDSKDTSPMTCRSARIRVPSAGAIITCDGTSLCTSVVDLSDISLDEDDHGMLLKDFDIDSFHRLEQIATRISPKKVSEFVRPALKSNFVRPALKGNYVRPALKSNPFDKPPTQPLR